MVLYENKLEWANENSTIRWWMVGCLTENDADGAGRLHSSYSIFDDSDDPGDNAFSSSFSS